MMGLIPGEFEGRNLKSAPASLDSLNHIVYVMDGCVVQYKQQTQSINTGNKHFLSKYKNTSSFITLICKHVQSKQPKCRQETPPLAIEHHSLANGLTIALL